MATADFQQLCELGQQQLMRTEYLAAERSLEEAERIAWDARDFDTLSRLYMPLQEARRQRRQLCGEGTVALDLIAQGPEDEIDGKRIAENFPHGQLLVAGWGTFAPAAEVRRLQREHGLYLETFLSAVYPIGAGRVIVVAPLEDVALPDLHPRSIDDLVRKLPAHCLILNPDELPQGQRKGDTTTFEGVMAMWERLHAPFLAAADHTTDPVQRIDGYRTAQRVDYGCELAHQKASDVARELVRSRRG
jgi:hypothetical protein